MKFLSFEILYIFFIFQILNFKFFLENFDPLAIVYRPPLPMVYQSPYQWYIDLPTIYNYWFLMQSTHDYTDLVNEWLTEDNGRG